MGMEYELWQYACFIFKKERILVLSDITTIIMTIISYIHKTITIIHKSIRNNNWGGWAVNIMSEDRLEKEKIVGKLHTTSDNK